ncbi:MAG: molybdenum ABC transporter ATP-binding protein [Pseudomonadota bacterium]
MSGPAARGIQARFALHRAAFTFDVDLALPGRGVTALFGPSGSGKTTLLRCIAGLEPCPDGRLTVNGSVWQDASSFLPTHRRPLGFVFQEASLFTHLTVRGNLDYGLKRVPAAQRSGTQAAAIELLGIEGLLERRTTALSGGERQRVAIARALAVSPQLLLLDEPLASLDQARKQEILPYLKRLHDELEIPVLYVSHAADEVARLADHLLLLDGGRVRAQGPLQETLVRLDLAAAFGDDIGAVIEARVVEHDDADQLTRLGFEGGSLWVSRCAEAPGARLRARVRAGDVSLSDRPPEGSSILNVLAVRVVETRAAGPPGQVLIRLDAQGTPLLARITGRSCRALQIEPGREVWAQVKSVALMR